MSNTQQLRVTISNGEGEVFEVLTWTDGIWRDASGPIGDHDEGLFGKTDEEFPLAGTEFATMVRNARRFFGAGEVQA